MAPIMPANGPLAGGSRSAIARCAATRCQPMPCASVGGFRGAATFSTEAEPTWHCSLGKWTYRGTTHGFSFPFPLLPFSEQSRKSKHLFWAKAQFQIVRPVIWRGILPFPIGKQLIDWRRIAACLGSLHSQLLLYWFL